MAYLASLGAPTTMRSRAQPHPGLPCCVFRSYSPNPVNNQGGGQRLSGPLALLHRNGGLLGSPPPPPFATPLMGDRILQEDISSWLLPTPQCPSVGSSPMPLSGLLPNALQWAPPQCPSVGYTVRFSMMDPLSCALSGLHIYIILLYVCKCCMIATVNIRILTSVRSLSLCSL